MMRVYQSSTDFKLLKDGLNKDNFSVSTIKKILKKNGIVLPSKRGGFYADNARIRMAAQDIRLDVAVLHNIVFAPTINNSLTVDSPSALTIR